MVIMVATGRAGDLVLGLNCAGLNIRVSLKLLVSVRVTRPYC